MGNKHPLRRSSTTSSSTSKQKKQTDKNKYDTHFIKTAPTTEPPTNYNATAPQSPAQKDLQKLREQLAQTTLRVHVYQQQRQIFEEAHKTTTPWNFEKEKEEQDDSPAAKLAKLRAELNSAKSELVTTKAAVHRKRVENGRASEEVATEAKSELVTTKAAVYQTHVERVSKQVVAEDVGTTEGIETETDGDGDGDRRREGEREREREREREKEKNVLVTITQPQGELTTSFPGDNFFDSENESDDDVDDDDRDNQAEGWL